MILSKARISWLGLGAFWALASGMPAVADDTELFIGNSLSSQAQPNILFIIDNSGSMGSLVLTQDELRRQHDVPAVNGCDATRVYWRTGTGNPPACGTNNCFNVAALKCDRALRRSRPPGSTPTTWRSTTRPTGGGGRRWETIAAAQKTRVVECQDDRGVHGDGVDAANLYARNGSNDAPATGARPAKKSRGARRPRTRPTRCTAATT